MISFATGMRYEALVFTNRYLTITKLLLLSSLFICLFSSFHLPPISTIPPNRHHHHQQVYCSISSSSSSSSSLSSGSCLPMDTFFISHGSPTLSIDDGLPPRHFFKSWKARVFQATPRAVLMVSAHWDTSEPTVNAVVGPTDTIYDFYGFPNSMYKIKYPAPGAPDLANRVKELLKHAGFGRVKEDKKRGLDHGAWVPLMLMYPEANIPVCQLSVQAHKDALYHYNLGKALAPLREEGVLIIGSGSATHNLRMLAPDGTATPKWAADFDDWLKDALLSGRYDDVNNYLQKAPSAKMAHPWPEHFYPLHVALGAAGDKATAEMIHQSWSNGALSYASYRFKTN